MRAEEVLAAEGWTLPTAHPVVANYRLVVQVGSLMFVSGHGPFLDGRPTHTGKLGAGLTVEDGRDAARTVIMNIWHADGTRRRRGPGCSPPKSRGRTLYTVAAQQA